MKDYKKKLRLVSQQKVSELDLKQHNAEHRRKNRRITVLKSSKASPHPINFAKEQMYVPAERVVADYNEFEPALIPLASQGGMSKTLMRQQEARVKALLLPFPEEAEAQLAGKKRPRPDVNGLEALRKRLSGPSNLR